MKQYKVAILGATGAVGREMMKVLAERDFPVSELHLLASARSAGEVLPWKERDITVEQACDQAFAGMDIVLGAAENDVAKRFAPAIVRSGAVFVDNSSAFRMDPDVPLVVPEINPEDVKKHKGIIANPNCTTIVSLVAINALNQDSPIESIVASSYQAVSGAGAGGPIELMNEVEALGLGQQIEPKVFQYQIAYNVIPQIGGEAFDGYTSEEMKLQNEGRKIMHLPELKVSCTCVRVPVVRSHSVSLVVRTREKISVAGVVSSAPPAGRGAVRRGAVACDGLPPSGRLYGCVRRRSVPPGLGNAAAHPEGLPLRGLRGDLHGAAGHDPMERLFIYGGRPPAAAGADPRGQPGIGGYGGADAAAHEHQPVQRHGEGRRAGFRGGGAFGGGVRAAHRPVGQLRPAGGGHRLWTGGVVRLPTV